MGDFTGQSQGRTIMSWIWLTHGISNNDAESLQDTLCVEWCKARARQNCWSKEVRLLLEEMQRVLAFFNWQVQWWEDHISLQTLARLEETKGLIAYAKQQASIQRRLSASFREKWKDVPALVATGMGIDLTGNGKDEHLCLDIPPQEDLVHNDHY
ncbi:hypothetical protein EV424DRAFT_1316410 [Suillus variegatus]|nr:hypothetical protein EV424DRAFT_1316410 [Suillus variegatus]